jgi:hypothetical protein
MVAPWETVVTQVKDGKLIDGPASLPEPQEG